MRTREKACLVLLVTIIMPSILLALNVAPVMGPEEYVGVLYFHREDASNVTYSNVTYGAYKKTMNTSSPTFPADNPATIVLTTNKALVWYSSPIPDDVTYLSGNWNFSFWYTADAPVSVAVLVAWFNESGGGPANQMIIKWTGDNKINLTASATPTEVRLSQNPGSYTVSAYNWRLGACIRNTNATLTVYYDCAGRESHIEVPGELLPDVTPPVAEAGEDQTVKLGEEVFFNGSASYDPNGSIARWDWDFADGTNGTGMLATHTYMTPGVKVVTLNVTDAANNTDIDTVNITVLDEWTERPNVTLTFPPQYPNVIVLGWDGAQRNHVYEMLNRGELPHLRQLFTEGVLVNNTVPEGAFFTTKWPDLNRDHATDTKAGWCQFNTGYTANLTGVYSNGNFSEIPDGYTVFERVKAFFGGDIVTLFITGKYTPLVANLDPGTPYTNARPEIDVFNVSQRPYYETGPVIYQALNTYGTGHYYAFLHFREPDPEGHKNGENSPQYEGGIRADDMWLGTIVAQLKRLGVYETTYIYLVVDHGFDEGNTSHSNAPYIFLATNDPLMPFYNDTWQWDVAPTALRRAGLDISQISPPLTGTPLVPPHAPIKPQVEIGETMDIDVIAKNHVDTNQTFSVTLRYDETVIGVQTVTDLPPGVRVNLRFTWNTTGVPPGNYTITANTTLAPDSFVGGTVALVVPPRVTASLPYDASAVYSDDAACRWHVNVTVLVENEGAETENFTVTAYYDGNLMNTLQGNPQTVTNLAPGENTIVTFTWNATGVAPCKYKFITNTSDPLYPGYYIPYNISANVSSPALGETMWPGGNVTVRLPGDGSGDGRATGSDLAILGRSWYKNYPNTGYDWRADWSGDGQCTGSDLAILGRNWYKQAEPA